MHVKFPRQKQKKIMVCRKILMLHVFFGYLFSEFLTTLTHWNILKVQKNKLVLPVPVGF